MATTASEWVSALADALGVDGPDPATVEALLELAATAAHASERTAAPITCWLIGRAGIDPQSALATARALTS
jgi:hypothetical protein